MAHSAVAVIAGPNGRREVAVEDFCTAPGQNVLQNGEFLVSLQIPAPAAGFGRLLFALYPAQLKWTSRVVGAGSSVVLSGDGSTITSARVALGAVAPTPIMVGTAALAGQPANEATINAAVRGRDCCR